MQDFRQVARKGLRNGLGTTLAKGRESRIFCKADRNGRGYSTSPKSSQSATSISSHGMGGEIPLHENRRHPFPVASKRAAENVMPDEYFCLTCEKPGLIGAL